MDVEQARIARIDERNEARKEEVLAYIPAAAWQKAPERINGQERIFMRRPDEALSSIARVREKFWDWLKHSRPDELLCKQCLRNNVGGSFRAMVCSGCRFRSVYERASRRDTEGSRRTVGGHLQDILATHKTMYASSLR